MDKRVEPVRYFLDTEFYTDRDHRKVTLISIGVVAESPDQPTRTYYAQSLDFDPNDGTCTDSFVHDRVLPVLLYCPTGRTLTDHITGSTIGRCSRTCPWRTEEQIRSDLLSFIIPERNVPLELWGDYAAFDYVVLSHLMGSFSAWPEEWPMFIHEIQHYRDDLLARDCADVLARSDDWRSDVEIWHEAFPHLSSGTYSSSPDMKHNALFDAMAIRDSWRWLRACDPRAAVFAAPPTQPPAGSTGRFVSDASTAEGTSANRPTIHSVSHI